MEGDPLADVLTLASARCVRIGTLKAGGTWALNFPPPQKIKLTAVVKGNCWLAVDGERAPHRLGNGRRIRGAGRAVVRARVRLEGLSGRWSRAVHEGDGQRRESRRWPRLPGHWRTRRVGSRPGRPARRRVASSDSRRRQFVRSLDDSMAPGSARQGGDRQSSRRGVGVEAACAAAVRPDYPVLPRRRHDCHGRLAPSAQRRAHRAGVAPHARRTRSGLATRRPGEARGDVTNQLCAAFQSERWRRPSHLPPELANAPCGAGAPRAARCRSPSWPSPSATNQTARSATRSSGEPAWHPSTINPSSHGWTSPHQMRPIRIHGTHPERIAYATCVNPPSTNSSTPLT